jgi:hypothetical protein
MSSLQVCLRCSQPHHTDIPHGTREDGRAPAVASQTFSTSRVRRGGTPAGGMTGALRPDVTAMLCWTVVLVFSSSCRALAGRTVMVLRTRVGVAASRMRVPS